MAFLLFFCFIHCLGISSFSTSLILYYSFLAENEETEGSDVPADYLLGDVEGDEDELYMVDHEHPHRKSYLQLYLFVNRTMRVMLAIHHTIILFNFL